MSIKRGNALKEDARAVLTETKFSKSFEEDLLLLLEGSDDIKVIDDYFLYKNSSKNYRLIKANDDNIDESYQFAGKNNALNLYEDLKKKGRKVICLLDRDYDFYLGEEISDAQVKYYDYYELENYLFEEAIMKLVVKNVYDFSDRDELNRFVDFFKEIEEACKSYSLICFCREVNFRKSILTEVELQALLKIINKKPYSMMQIENLGTENKLERINIFIEKELNKVGLDLETIIALIESQGYDCSGIINNKEILDHFRYNIKGKTLINCLQTFANYIFEVNPDLNTKKSGGNLDSLSTRLKMEWIPAFSEDFEELMKNIESQFQNMKIAAIR